MTVSIEKLHEETIAVIKSAIVDLIESQGQSRYQHPLSRAIGKYGANVNVLKKNGFVKSYAVFNGELANPRVWTGKLNILSREDFYSNPEVQENLNTVELRDLYEELSLNGGIQPDDPEADIAGLLVAAKGFGSRAVLQFRQGQNISPRPSMGVYQTTNDTDMTSQLIPWFQKGYSTVAQAGTLDLLNKSPDFMLSYYLAENEKASLQSVAVTRSRHRVDYSLGPAERQANALEYLVTRRAARSQALNKFKVQSDLRGKEAVIEFYRQVRAGKIKY